MENGFRGHADSSLSRRFSAPFSFIAELPREGGHIVSSVGRLANGFRVALPLDHRFETPFRRNDEARTMIWDCRT